MGEASRRQKLKERVIGSCPYCVYCGGIVPATTIDHMPPIAMFDRRQRPKGLEFASCDGCNQGSKRAEQVACLIGRSFPDAGTDEGRAEVAKMMAEVHSNHPGLLEEMQHSEVYGEEDVRVLAQAPAGSGLLRVDGPLVTDAVQRFCAKLALALHYEYTKKIVPAAGGVFVRWYSNYDLVNQDVPQHIVAMMGDPRTLRQGTRGVDGQFLYASRGTTTGSMSGHFVSFRISFAFVAIVADDMDKLSNANGMNLYRPGLFRI